MSTMSDVDLAIQECGYNPEWSTIVTTEPAGGAGRYNHMYDWHVEVHTITEQDEQVRFCLI